MNFKLKVRCGNYIGVFYYWYNVEYFPLEPLLIKLLQLYFEFGTWAVIHKEEFKAGS